MAREFWWTLGELWSVRWNPGFSVPARRYLFRPWARRFGGNVATIGVFAVSGWLHEIVISLPAVGGFGLPTIYFLIQGAGVLFEKRLNNPLVKRLFTIVVALVPLPLLIHGPFVHHVLIPFFAELGIVGGLAI